MTKFLVLFIGALTVADFAFTQLSISLGYAEEANPLLAPLFHSNLPQVNFLALLLMLLPVFILYHLIKRLGKRSWVDCSLVCALAIRASLIGYHLALALIWFRK